MSGYCQDCGNILCVCDEVKKGSNSYIIAIDFDGVIAEQLDPYTGDVGVMIKDARYYINKLFYKGYYIIIWTCRGDQGLVKMKNWLDEQGIKYHKINENANWDILGYKPLPKIFYHVLVDDRNAFGFQGWVKTYRWIIDNFFYNEK